MEKQNVFFTSAAIDLSETETYIDMKNRLCWYGEPNANGVILSPENADEYAKTLIGMPVVAKYKTIDGKPDLGGHEVHINPLTGEYKFGTENVGAHMDVYVEDDTVNVFGSEKELPCLFATSRIWKRNKNVVAAIKRLFEDGKLFSSWELISFDYEELPDGNKLVKDYAFEANCLLGSNSYPAYGPSATALSLAETDPEFIIAEALAIDIAEREAEEGNIVEIKVNTEPEVVEAEVVEPEIVEADVEVQPEIEVSEVTEFDLSEEVSRIMRERLCSWAYVAYIFMDEAYVLVRSDICKRSLDYLKVPYTINDGVITVGEYEEVHLVVAPGKINAEIAERDNALVAANEEINSMRAEIEELKPYREEHDRIEAEKLAAELAAKQEEIKSYMINSGLISEEETTSEEISSIISEVNYDAAKSLIADRFVASLNHKEPKEEKIVSERAYITFDNDERYPFIKSYINKK